MAINTDGQSSSTGQSSGRYLHIGPCFLYREKVPSAGIEKGTTSDGWISLDGRMTHHDSLSASTLLEIKGVFRGLSDTDSCVRACTTRPQKEKCTKRASRELGRGELTETNLGPMITHARTRVSA